MLVVCVCEKEGDSGNRIFEERCWLVGLKHY